MGRGIGKAVEHQNQVALASNERKAFGLASVAEQEDRNQKRDGTAFVVLRYFRSAFECFSDWGADELKAFSAFNSKMGSVNWTTLETSGGFQKKALNTATIDKSAAQHLSEVTKLLSPEISFIELRVDQKLRVHGFRAKDGFFLVLLDRRHRVCPE